MLPIESAYWAVSITGDPADLHLWETALQAPSDPWVVKRDHQNECITLLRSRYFGPANTHEEVHDRAANLITPLNGAMRIFCNTKPVWINGTWEYKSSGSVVYRRFPERHGSLPGVSAFAAAGHLAAPPASKPQTWTKLSESNLTVNELLHHMGSANDWLNLYKAYECLLQLFSEEDLKAKGWATGKDLELFRRNANYYHRHRYQPDIDPPS